MRVRDLGTSFILLATVALAGCGSSPASPSNTSLNGTYSGAVQDSINGVGTLSAALAQNGSSVTGTYSVAYPVGNSSGSFTGSFGSGNLTGVLAPSNPLLCSSNLTGVVSQDGTTITGNYASFNCTGSESGNFTIVRH
jgi:hypothetical protein